MQTANDGPVVDNVCVPVRTSISPVNYHPKQAFHSLFPLLSLSLYHDYFGIDLFFISVPRCVETEVVGR
jgi:hypothetical protein